MYARLLYAYLILFDLNGADIKASELQLSITWQEGSCDATLLVEFLYGGLLLQGPADVDQRLKDFHMVGIQLFEVVGSLCDLEVSKCEVADSCVLIADVVSKLLDLDLEFVIIEPHLIGVMVGTEEHGEGGVEDIVKKRKDHLYLCLILGILAQ